MNIQSALRTAEQHLSTADPVMATLIKKHGACGLKPQMASELDCFFVLCDSIISQQLSVKASATILKRFCALFPNNQPAAQALVSMPHELLRGVGLSNAKARYVQDLAAKFLDGTLQHDDFTTMADEELIQHLTQVKGIGRWTAEMFLIFSLNRLDVLAVDDLGLRKAIQMLYDCSELPKPSQMLTVGEVWKPYRSVASWYLWRSLDNAGK